MKSALGILTCVVHLALTFGCASSDNEEESPCPSGEKLCENERECVSVDDPFYGCSEDACGCPNRDPLEGQPGIHSRTPVACNNDATCVWGYRCDVSGRLDCDRDQLNGCEVDALADNFNCGVCGNVCPSGQSCVTDLSSAWCQ